VVLSCEGNESEKRAVEYLTKNTKKCIVKSKTARKGSVELNMEVRLKDDNTDFVNTLADMPGVQNAVLVSFNGDYMG
jgi:adenylyl- and sulfurtransferase ThiI